MRTSNYPGFDIVRLLPDQDGMARPLPDGEHPVPRKVLLGHVQRMPDRCLRLPGVQQVDHAEVKTHQGEHALESIGEHRIERLRGGGNPDDPVQYGEVSVLLPERLFCRSCSFLPVVRLSPGKPDGIHWSSLPPAFNCVTELFVVFYTAMVLERSNGTGSRLFGAFLTFQVLKRASIGDMIHYML